MFLLLVSVLLVLFRPTSSIRARVRIYDTLSDCQSDTDPYPTLELLSGVCTKVPSSWGTIDYYDDEFDIFHDVMEYVVGDCTAEGKIHARILCESTCWVCVADAVFELNTCTELADHWGIILPENGETCEDISPDPVAAVLSIYDSLVDCQTQTNPAGSTLPITESVCALVPLDWDGVPSFMRGIVAECQPDGSALTRVGCDMSCSMCMHSVRVEMDTCTEILGVWGRANTADGGCPSSPPPDPISGTVRVFESMEDCLARTPMYGTPIAIAQDVCTEMPLDWFDPWGTPDLFHVEGSCARDGTINARTFCESTCAFCAITVNLELNTCGQVGTLVGVIETDGECPIVPLGASTLKLSFLLVLGLLAMVIF